MTGYTVCAVVLLAGGLAPSLYVVASGDPIERLAGLELVGAIAVVVMLLLALISGQSYYLAVPLVLAPLSVAGTLVFTRLLGERDDS